MFIYLGVVVEYVIDDSITQFKAVAAVPTPPVPANKGRKSVAKPRKPAAQKPTGKRAFDASPGPGPSAAVVNSETAKKVVRRIRVNST